MKLESLLNDGKLVLIPMDDGLLDGPVGGLRDMRRKVAEIANGQADAILGFLGVRKQCLSEMKNTKFILNLTGSTPYSGNPQRKFQLYTAAQAKELGVDGVAVHVNVGSVHLHDQMEIFGRVAAGCQKHGLPLLAIVYPRGEMIREDGVVEATVYSARMAAEVGADFVKTKYFGRDAFARVVEGCPIPVIMAGGPRATENPTRTILEKVYDCIQVGGAGVAIGRNAFHHENTTSMVRALVDIVHHKNTVADVMEKYQLKE